MIDLFNKNRLVTGLFLLMDQNLSPIHSFDVASSSFHLIGECFQGLDVMNLFYNRKQTSDANDRYSL